MCKSINVHARGILVGFFAFLKKIRDNRISDYRCNAKTHYNIECLNSQNNLFKLYCLFNTKQFASSFLFQHLNVI